MQYTKTFITTTAIVTGLLLTACTSSSINSYNDYVYQGINFGSDRDASFKKGVQDACKTADGDYTKDHTKFNSNESYRIGWEDGRLKCKGK
ncbi:hypothetical protein ACLHDG_12080 [Sulfurovum sp. CS9]|uniref:hypothetical protein n=1 Tax=Sulfurovum sp. CS9 TaxID=3391146 RepID=UPI0039EBED97